MTREVALASQAKEKSFGRRQNRSAASLTCEMKNLMRFLLVGSLLWAAVACGSATNSAASPQSSPSAIPTGAAITQADLVAVAQLVYPKQDGYYGVCGGNGDPSSCPYSDRLKARLTETKETLLRGAQNPSTTLAASAELLGPSTGIAHVALFQGRMNFDLWMTRQRDQLVVDDQICSGHKETSIYITPVVPCQS
jgi:hypothetical protein